MSKPLTSKLINSAHKKRIAIDLNSVDISEYRSSHFVLNLLLMVISWVKVMMQDAVITLKTLKTCFMYGNTFLVIKNVPFMQNDLYWCFFH